MAEEEHIPQLDGPATIVLGELVLIKLREGCRQPLLHLTGEWHTPVLPVDGNEFGELIGTLDHASERLRHRRAVRFVTRHFADEQKRRVAQLHLLAGLDGKRRPPSLPRPLGTSSAMRPAISTPVLVELALPKQAGQHRAPQLHLRRDVPCRRALVRARCGVEIECVQSGHLLPPFFHYSPGN